MVGDKVEEVKWKGLGVNDHWQQMKGIMMETAQDICGMTKDPPRHKETWWWNEEVAEAVRNKKIYMFTYIVDISHSSSYSFYSILL